MKARIFAAGLIVLASFPIFARGPNVQFGFQFGVPAWGPWYYPPYYYPPAYYPPPVYYPPAYYPPLIHAPSPPAYMEQSGAPGEEAQSWWYYCAESKAYYPYVKTCPGNWELVSPRPPG